MAYPAQLRADVTAYAKKNKDESADSIGLLFGVPGRTVRRWLSSKDDRTKRKKTNRAASKPAKKAGNKGEESTRRAAEPASRAREEPLLKRGGRRPRARAKAEEIAQSDRVEALSIVRGARSVAARYLEQMERDFLAWEIRNEEIDLIEDPEERREARRLNKLPRIDREETQALLNLQKTAAEVLDTHPGLLELDRDTASADDDRESRRERVRKALNLAPKKNL